VQVIGLDEVPEAGDEFRVVEAERFARDVAERRSARERRKELADRRPTTLEEFTSAVEAGDKATLNVIIKADVSGSAEALEDALLKLELEEVQVRVLQKGVGAISQGDVRLAEASNAIIVAFNVRPGTNVREEIARTGVDVRTYRIIYEAIEDIEFGDAESRYTIDLNASTKCRRIEPTATPGPSGDRSELIAPLGQMAAHLVLQLGWEWARTNPRGIGLGESEYIVNLARANAGTRTHGTGHAVATGHVGIGAVIDVEQRALGALE
jgi:hypothetical protein